MWSALRSFWFEAKPPEPTGGALRGRMLAAAVLLLSVIEAALRPDLVWRPLVVVLGAGLALGVLWRRSRPLLVWLAAFGTLSAVDLVAGSFEVAWVTPYVSATTLLFVYSLLRWAAGWEAVTGLGVFVVGHALTLLHDFPGFGDAISGYIVGLFPAVLGASLRYRAREQLRELERIKLLEREQLAREVHDTVAHAMSAIAIQSQAGHGLARSRPEAAAAALLTIEEISSRALEELREIVRALRHDEPADFTPRRRITDIDELVATSGSNLEIRLRRSGSLDDLTPTIEATMYRLAQESITNAVRHARNATRIDLDIHGGKDAVSLTVSDDGDTRASSSTVGYGLRGMAERVALVGGTWEAGRGETGGWRVHVTLPRRS